VEKATKNKVKSGVFSGGAEGEAGTADRGKKKKPRRGQCQKREKKDVVGKKGGLKKVTTEKQGERKKKFGANSIGGGGAKTPARFGRGGGKGKGETLRGCRENKKKSTGLG